MTVRWRRIAFPLLALAAALFLASTLSSVLSPVLFAMLLAVILNPVVNAPARLRMPRVVTVGLIYLVIALLLAVTSSGIGRQFTALGRALGGEPWLGDFNNNGLIDLGDGLHERAEFRDLNGNGRYDPGALLVGQSWINRELYLPRGGLLDDVVNSLRTATLSTLTQFARPAGDLIAQVFANMTRWAGGVLELMTLLVLVPFYLFFFLVEYPRISGKLHDLVPPRHREQVDRVTRDIGQEMVSFLRGRLACGAVKAVILWCGMAILGIPYALPIAIVSGLLSLIPFLGFLVGVLPASIIGLTMPGGGTTSMLLAVALFLVAEAIEGAVLFPIILGRETGLHPVTLVVVLLAGGALMGTLGVIVAIPLALVCKILWRETGMPLYREWAYPDGEPASGS